MFQLSDKPLEKMNLREGLESSRAGAFNSFEGMVRDHNDGKHVVALEYEAAIELCQSEAQKIFSEARSKFNVIDYRCYHRVGRLEIGEMAVWVGVIAEHRDDSFRACRYIIDEIKHRLPIWKKEFYADGDSGWINCENCDRIAADEQQFYSRQSILPEIGVDGQNQLKQYKTLVVGAGGLGCPALISLASAGVGTIGICEHDVLETSNLHRQSLYSHNDVGQSKVTLAAERLQALNPFIKIEQHPQKLDCSNAEAVIKDYDVVLDCTDNFPAKYLLNDVCYLKKIPLVQASVHQWEGQLRITLPEKSPCLRCLWPSMPQPGCTGDCEQSGVIGAVPSVLGHFQALETIKIILNLPDQLTDQTLMVNLKTLEIQKIQESVNPMCPLCGKSPTITTISEMNYSAACPLSISIMELTPEEFKNFTFIDVRESTERMLTPIQEVESIHLPLSKFGKTKFHFDKNTKYVIFCAKGIRSLKLTEHLHEQGITNTLSLSEGTDAFKHYVHS